MNHRLLIFPSSKPCLVVAVRAGGGLGAVLELQVAAVVLVELERGGGGEGQLVWMSLRGRGRALL